MARSRVFFSRVALERPAFPHPSYAGMLFTYVGLVRVAQLAFLVLPGATSQAILNAALLAAALCMRDDEPLPFTSIVLDRNQVCV